MRLGEAVADDPQLEGVVELQWLPAPEIRARFWGDASAAASFFEVGDKPGTDGTAKLPNLPTIGVPPAPVVVSPEKPASARFWGERQLDPIAVGAGPLRRLVVNVVNFAGVLGTALGKQLRDGRREWLGRIELSSATWHVSLDLRHDAKEVEGQLQRSGGFAFTHIAELRRTGGEEFTVDEAQTLLEALRRFLSFAHGAQVAYALPTGFDQHDTPVWSWWSVTTCDRWNNRLSWHDDHHPEQLTELFPRFMDRWDKDFWRDVIAKAIGYYLEANNEGFVEKRLVMAYSGLEMMAWTVLYEQEDWLRADELRRPRASTLLRLLLRWCGIPTKIPSQLAALDEYTFQTLNKPKLRSDGPVAGATIRNRIAHPRRNDRPPTNAVVDGWLLLSWYLELVLLRVCGYEGSYANRLIRNRWLGSVEPVPWAG